MRRIVNGPEKLDGFRVVSNGTEILDALRNGETVMHWETGDSMFPILMSREYCKIRPLGEGEEANVGDAVFCTFNGKYHMVHRCSDKYNRNGRVYYQISTTGGEVYGWTSEVWGVAESTDIFQKEDDTLARIHEFQD